MNKQIREIPREIADGVWWVGGCLESAAFDEPVHFHTSAYLIVGADETLLFDTAPPGTWEVLQRDLRHILGDRQLDYIVPSHPEIPHAGCLTRLLDEHRNARVIGDLRDYHLYFPDYIDRMHPVPHGTKIELGGGFALSILDAVIEDLPSTVWGYEHKRQVLFPVDAMGYGHLPQSADLPDEPLHRPGECALMASELDHPPSMDLAQHLTQSSLYWSRFVDISPYMDRFDELLAEHPARLIAPAHGSVIDDLGVIMPVMREAHRRAYESTHAQETEASR